MAPIQSGLDMLAPVSRRAINMPWSYVERWNPIKIDALGLVTLLGAEEVGRAVGSLQKRKITEYLPLLGAFIIAGDRFTDQQLGFEVYNLTDKIHSTTGLKGWFTRWLAAQDISFSTTVIRWTYSDDNGHAHRSNYLTVIVSFVLVAPSLPCAILTGDWWGMANRVAIVASILVRIGLLARLRNELDERASEPGRSPGETKILISRPDGSIVTILASGPMLRSFMRAFGCTSSSAYRAMGLAGWIAFAIHACVLGMCTLLSQIYTVVLLVGSTLLMVQRFHFDISARRGTVSGWPGTSIEGSETTVTRPFGGNIVVEQLDPGGVSEKLHTTRRIFALARLQLSEEEEDTSRQWELPPSNDMLFEGWYRDYSKLKAQCALGKELQLDA